MSENGQAVTIDDRGEFGRYGAIVHEVDFPWQGRFVESLTQKRHQRERQGFTRLKGKVEVGPRLGLSGGATAEGADRNAIRQAVTQDRAHGLDFLGRQL